MSMTPSTCPYHRDIYEEYHMALSELHYFSTALEKMTTATVILPEGDDMPPGPYPVFYLLHGLSDDHTRWHSHTSLARYVEGMPLIIVMPDGGRGWYTDAREGYAYETAIVRDLIGLVDRVYHTDPRREARVIGGLSMGGYGAVKLALKRPDLFRAAVSHSGALAVGHGPLDPSDARGREMVRIFGREPRGGDDDLFALAERIDRGMLPALRIDCGVDDFLLDQNRAFHARLDDLNIPHEYAEFPGGHTWDYWDRHVQEALAFHARVLGLAARPRP